MDVSDWVILALAASIPISVIGLYGFYIERIAPQNIRRDMEDTLSREREADTVWVSKDAGVRPDGSVVSRNSKEQIVVIQKSSASGIIAFVFGVLSIFILAPIFVPLALICGLIALFSGGSNAVWGVFGVITAVIGALTSPIILGLIGLAAAS